MGKNLKSFLAHPRTMDGIREGFIGVGALFATGVMGLMIYSSFKDKNVLLSNVLIPLSFINIVGSYNSLRKSADLLKDSFKKNY
jgi:hypothetical protein